MRRDPEEQRTRDDDDDRSGQRARSERIKAARKAKLLREEHRIVVRGGSGSGGSGHQGSAADYFDDDPLPTKYTGKRDRRKGAGRSRREGGGSGSGSPSKGEEGRRSNHRSSGRHRGDGERDRDRRSNSRRHGGERGARDDENGRSYLRSGSDGSDRERSLADRERRLDRSERELSDRERRLEERERELERRERRREKDGGRKGRSRSRSGERGSRSGERGSRSRSREKARRGGADSSDDDSDYVSALDIKVQEYEKVGFLRKGANQNIIAGIVAFTGPGLFNAMQGLGNAGGSDPKVAATMNATLYATFSVFGVISGYFFNTLGCKLLMSFGAFTYAFYALSVYLWGQVGDQYASMAIVASAVLGLGAACLWGAQGTMTLSYAREHEKGRFFGIFWLIFNMGGVMGGLIAFGVNSGPADERASSVSPATYFTFCTLMVSGAIFAFIFVINSSRVVKSDGSPVPFEMTGDSKGELGEIIKLFCNRYMLLLTPLIIQSNWFYAYEFGGINGLLFDAPTRGLNSAFYWLISGISSYFVGTRFLDSESVGGRHRRAVQGLKLVSAINLGQWIYALIYQFSTGYDKGNSPDPLINYSDGGAYAGPMLLFMYCGLADSIVQTYAYWIIGAISNSPKTLSRYVGYYKGIQSLGACFAWIIEAGGTSYKAQLLICFSLAVIFIPPTYVVATCVKDEGTEDEFVDEEGREKEIV